MTKRRSALPSVAAEERFWTEERFWNEIRRRIDARLSPEQRAAIAEYEEEQRNAWKNVSEFDNVLQLAISCGVLKPLRDYVAAGRPIPNEEVFAAGRRSTMKEFVSDLLGGQPLPQSSARGRPRRVASEANPIVQAERNAAWRVALKLRDWRAHHASKRVARNVTNKMIRAVIKEAAKTFAVPVDAISASNIEALLKSGRIVVGN